MADAQKSEDLPSKVQTYKQQYDNPRMTFFLGGSPETSPPPPPGDGGQRATLPVPSAASLAASDSSDQSRLDVPGSTSPGGDSRRSSECLVSAPQSRAGSGSAIGSRVASMESEASPKDDEDGEIKYIDEDVDEAIDGESIPVRVTFKDDQTSAAAENNSPAAGAPHSPSKEEIMSKFEEQERSFREQFLSQTVLDLSMKREEELAKSPLPLSPISPQRDEQFVLDRNLHYLIKVMEQMSLLRRQNRELVKKCYFLEDTRELLQLQNDLLLSKDHGRGRMLFGQKIMNYFDMGMSQSSSVNIRSVSPVKPRWERVPSEGSDIVLSSTPQKGGKIQRSQSEGSLDLVDMDFTISPSSEHRSTSIQKTSSREHFISRADFHKKSRKLQQKWERVKKVFSGKPEIGIKTDSGAVSAEQLVRANTKRIQGKQRPPNLQNLPKHGDLLQRPEHTSSETSPNQQEIPDTPNSVKSEPASVLGVEEEGYSDSDINVPVLKRSHSAGSMASDNGNGSRRFIFDDHSLSDQECNIEKILFLRQEGRLDRRRSSPTISVHEHDKDFPSFEQARLARSSSAKFVKSSSDVDLKGLKPSRHDTAAKAKAAWDRVKDIIHARKDSLKKSKPSAGQSSSDGEISPDAVMSERATFHLDPEDLVIPRSQPASGAEGPTAAGGAVPMRARTMKPGAHPGRRSPSTKQKRKSLAHVILNNSPTDVAAIMGITDDFNKRMQEWEEKKRGGLIKANSFSCEMDPPRTFDSNASTKFTEEFIKKMEQWEQMKGLSSPPKSPDPDNKPKEPPVRPAERPVQLDTLPQPHPALHNLSESFSKTVQEWERVKERRAQEGTSPGREPRGRQRTVERSKSRERDRSRHKYEKEIQKIERKEWKIEREKQKLERMKMKLDMAMESSSGSEGFGDSVTYEHMLKQLHERDVSRAISSQQTETRVLASQHQEATLVTDETLHHRSLSTKEFKEVKVQQRERVLSSGVLPHGPGLFEGLDPGDSPPDRSRLAGALLDKPAKLFKGDLHVDPRQQQSPERVRRLTRQLEDKEEHIKDLQYDIQQLTDRISLMDREHNHKVESFKRQLRVANKMGQYAAQSYQIDSALRELRNQVDVLIQAQDILVKEKHALEKKLHTMTLEHEESRRLLLDQIQTLQERLDERGYVTDPTPRPAVTALCGLVTQAQGQINHLRHTLDNRAQLIKELERHALTQKVNNKLLEAGLQRQALEISFLRQQSRKKVIKRSKTFSGHEFCVGQDGNIQLRQDRKLADHCKKYSLSKRPVSPQIGDPPSDVINLDLHSNWLEVINRQLEQEEPPSAPKLAETLGTQTVMTLINCPYRTINIPTTREKVDRTTQSEVAAQEVASTQTTAGPATAVESEVEHLDGVTADSSPEVVPIVATVTDVDVPTIVARCSVIPKPGILKSHIPRPKGSEQKSSLPSPKPRKPPPSESPGTGSASSIGGNGERVDDSKRHSYQELLKRDPRPFTLSTWRTASLDVPVGKESQTLGYDSMTSSTEEAKGAGDRDENLLSPESSSSSLLPHSPVIRSKNLRKLKNSENKPTSVATDTARMLKATPPRRFIRHRKNMVERLSMGSMLTAETDSHLPPVSDARIRSKSDSSELQAACAIARDNSFKRREEEKIARTGEHISRMQNLLEVRSMASRSSSRSSSGVRNMISRYEEGNFARGNVFRKSPSPSVPRFSVTSPRRLKTAAELLQDSMDQKEFQIKSATIGTPREKLPSTSSDKENSSNSNHPKGPVRQGAIDSGSPLTSVRSQHKPTLLALATSIRREDHSDSQELAKPLKDRTNDRPDDSTSSHLDDLPVGGESESLPRDSEGQVKPKRVPLATITPPSNKRNISKPHPKADQRTVAGTTAVKPESTSNKRDPDHPRHMSKAGSLDSSQSAWSSDRDDGQPSSPWLVSKDVYKFEASPKPSPKMGAERKSRSLAKGRFWSKGPHHLFDRKRTVSPSPARGAISALCMHTMTVSVDDESTDSPPPPSRTPRDSVPPSPGSDPGDKRSRRQKFLDSNWFQKPKGFFKVSKC